MKGSDMHTFRLSLAPKQYVHVVVEQQGIDVVVTLLDPDGALLIRMDSPNSKVGPEAVSTVARSAGVYSLVVSADNAQPAGSYVLKVEGPREANAEDENRAAAERMFMEARETADSSKSAIERYQEALNIWRQIGDVREQGYTLCKIGQTYRLQKDFGSAMKYLDEALSLLRDAQDFSGQAYVLNDKAAAQRDLGDDPLQAIGNYELAISLRKNIGDHWGQAQLYNNVGLLYSNIGQQQKAIQTLELARVLWRESGDRNMEMNALNNIARANLDQGNVSDAFKQFQEVLNFCGETRGPCNLEPFVRNSRGVIYDTWAEPEEALTEYDLALKLFRATKDKQGQVVGNKENEVIVLDNIGMVFAGLSDPQEALNYFEQALKIRQELKNKRGESVSRSNIGYALMLNGTYAEALKQLEQALQLSRDSVNRSFEAYTLVRQGAVHVRLREISQALERYQEALKIQKEIGDVRGQAITLDKIGEAYGLENQTSQSLQSYEQAREQWGRVGDRQGEALSLYGIARVEYDQNNFTMAGNKIDEAIAIVESLRTRISSHELRLTYFAARYDYYGLAIDTRMRSYDLTHSQTDMELALIASERARARSLLDLLTEAHANIRQGVDPQLLDRERSLQDRLTAKLERLQTPVSGKFSDEQKIASEKEIDALTTEYDRTQAEIFQHSPAYASLVKPQPLTPHQIQALLDEDTMLLEYALGDKRSYLWAVTRTDIFAYTLPSRSKIEKAVEDFRESIKAYEPPRGGKGNQQDVVNQYIANLKTANASYPQQALDLSRMVLGAVSSKIENKRLVIVADGALRYVPFSALPAPGDGPDGSLSILASNLLITKHQIVYQPSASALALIRAVPREAASKSVAVLADPVFDKTDIRVRNAQKKSGTAATPQANSSELKRALRDDGDTADGNLKLERLRYSGEEANAIVGAAPSGSWMKAVGFKANRETALSSELKQFRIVHFATHGLLDSKHPERSGIVLSLVDERGQPENGFLRLGDIYNLNLPVDLVVLSACRTGIGKQVNGEGLIGLTRGFMYAGAARVVASLWKVDDEATAELMKHFYRYMLEKKMSPAASLRLAQLDVMAAREQWRAPYYWAGFVLQGEWK